MRQIGYHASHEQHSPDALLHFVRAAHPIAERLPHEVEMRVRYLAIALVPVSLAALQRRPSRWVT